MSTSFLRAESEGFFDDTGKSEASFVRFRDTAFLKCSYRGAAEKSTAKPMAFHLSDLGNRIVTGLEVDVGSVRSIHGLNETSSGA